MPDQTESLLTSAAGGNPQALSALFEHHGPGLRAFLRLRMGPALRAKEASCDLVQSVFREVIQHLDRYRHVSPQSFRWWLYKTAERKLSNRCDYYLASKRSSAREEGSLEAMDDEALARCYSSVATPSAVLMRREQRERLEAAFDRLPEHYREVIAMARLAGLSHGEIAAATGRTEGATRQLLHRALASLAEALGGDEAP